MDQTSKPFIKIPLVNVTDINEKKYTLVDTKDVNKLNLHYLKVKRNDAGYAYCKKLGLIHRAVMGFKPGDGTAATSSTNSNIEPQYVDHINGNRLDNRRKNLRIVTPKQNAKNRTNDPRHPESAGNKLLVGVSFDVSEELYWTVHKKFKYYSNSDPRMCALCYDSVVYEIYGDGVRLNDNTRTPLGIDRWDLSDEAIKNIVDKKSKHTDYAGVKYCKEGWRAEYKVRLGIFKTPEEASEAYNKAANTFHGFTMS